MGFSEQLARGRVGEGLIARWLRRRGSFVVPAYEIEIERGKGPRVFAPDGALISPDLLCLHPGRDPVWIEAKHKTVFSWYRRLSRWETGIDERHWLDYCKVRDQIGIPVWLLFLHRESRPWSGDIEHLPPGVDSCPVGLFGIDIDKARDLGRFGGEHAGGMRYWWHGDLKMLATLGEVMV
jgi:hypothetical protein